MSEQEKDVTPEMLEDDAKAIMEEADRAHAEATVAANLARRRATELREARKANGGKDVELREWVSVATQIGKLIDGQAHPSGLVKRVSDFVKREEWARAELVRIEDAMLKIPVHRFPRNGTTAQRCATLMDGLMRQSECLQQAYKDLADECSKNGKYQALLENLRHILGTTDNDALPVLAQSAVKAQREYLAGIATKGGSDGWRRRVSEGIEKYQRACAEERALEQQGFKHTDTSDGPCKLCEPGGDRAARELLHTLAEVVP